MELDIFADTDTVVVAWVALVAGSIAAEQELDQYLAAAGRDMGQDFVPTSGMVIDLETYLPAECVKGTFSLTHLFHSCKHHSRNPFALYTHFTFYQTSH